MRKPGWYWVKVIKDGPWACFEWDGHAWWEGAREYPERVFDVVGPRIPTPDEPWQSVPIEPTVEMKQACDHDTPGPFTAWKAWQVMLAAAPKPETQP